MKVRWNEQTLREVLAARDRRQRLREILLEQYSCPLVQVSPLNPGTVKNTPYALRVQDLAEEAVLNTLEVKGFSILHEEGAREVTGPWALYVVKGEASVIKKALIHLEETHPLGRLFDLDVMDKNGIPLSRRLLGYPERRCIVCGDSVSACIREERHSAKDVAEAANRAVQRLDLWRSSFYGLTGARIRPRHTEDAVRIASLCEQALRMEVELTPKPGLVDREDSGAHEDMSVYTFYRSIFALVPYFQEMVLAGSSTCRFSPPRVLSIVRPIGIEAENAMFAATEGVNTHKGSIFLLGALCVAAGRLGGLEIPITPRRLFSVVRRMCNGLVRKELEQDSGFLPTKGWKAHKAYGVTGARGEAEKGFPTVRFFALPLLKILMLLFPGRKEHCLLTVLLGLLVCVKDTNILGRGGLEGLNWVRLFAFRVLLKGGAFTSSGMQLLRAFREQCKARHLSPGGSADLLACTIFVDLLTGKTG